MGHWSSGGNDSRGAQTPGDKAVSVVDEVGGFSKHTHAHAPTHVHTHLLLTEVGMVTFRAGVESRC